MGTILVTVEDKRGRTAVAKLTVASSLLEFQQPKVYEPPNRDRALQWETRTEPWTVRGATSSDTREFFIRGGGCVRFAYDVRAAKGGKGQLQCKVSTPEGTYTSSVDVSVDGQRLPLDQYGARLAESLGATEWSQMDSGQKRYYCIKVRGPVTVQHPGGAATFNNKAVLACVDLGSGGFCSVEGLEGLPREVGIWFIQRGQTGLSELFSDVLAYSGNACTSTAKEADDFVLTKIEQQFWGLPAAGVAEFASRAGRLLEKVLTFSPEGFLQEVGKQVAKYEVASRELELELAKAAIATMTPDELRIWAKETPEGRTFQAKVEELRKVLPELKAWAQNMRDSFLALNYVRDAVQIGDAFATAKDRIEFLEKALGDWPEIKDSFHDLAKDLFYSELIEAVHHRIWDAIVDLTLDPDSNRQFAALFSKAVEEARISKREATALLTSLASRGDTDPAVVNAYLTQLRSIMARHILSLSCCEKGFEIWRRTAGGQIRTWASGGSEFGENLRAVIRARAEELQKIEDFILTRPWLGLVRVVPAVEANAYVFGGASKMNGK